ncbi:beta-N-acetylhexosaminidase [Carboxylicivirga caseinilyticus]|uniref:beta-N-acetylhexosaminidase n=1 Tax=Carboxylicivirga caseinilyticus TaxID=3417572 RepID=UPI003D349E9D|nr:family 20 glycosylhydrolase [Marinilabiliaceae bacterium A049]
MYKILSICLIFFISVNMSSQKLQEYLLPLPKKIIVKEGKLSIRNGYLNLPHNQLIGQTLLLQNSLFKTGIKTQISPFQLFNQSETIQFINDYTIADQEYQLTINPEAITIKSGSDAGFYYALVTLNQIGFYAQKTGFWPCVEIIDKPDFPRRGIMLDISRDKVPTMHTLMSLIDQLAGLKINEIQLYTEHTFAYKNHEMVWKDASPMTPQEIQTLDKYCKERFIDLVPNQNSFGHMNRWLKHPEYTHLAELEEPGKTIWGMRSKNTLSPMEEGSLELMQELYAELLPNFSSKYFNIGCDETVELGVGKSKGLCKETGKGQVYLNYLLELKKEVDKYGRTTQFWGDIILNHPELISELPKDMVALIWGYEANHPFDKQCKQFAEAGLDYYVCPGTSSWLTIIGRNKNAFANLLNAAENGKRHNAKGYLITDWGDHGHWQPLSVSYPSFIYGAALSWNVSDSKDMDIAKATSQFLLLDETDIAGKVLVNLGNAYLKTGAITDNSNIFYQLLRRNNHSIKTDRWLKQIYAEKLARTKNFINDQIELLGNAQISSYDSNTVKQEIQLAAKLAIHACDVGIAKSQTHEGYFKDISLHKQKEFIDTLDYIIMKHQTIWMLRNRKGGLEDSVTKLENIKKSYE